MGGIVSTENRFAVSGVLGLPFDLVTMNGVLEYIDSRIQSRAPGYITTANLDFATQAATDEELQQIIFDAHLNLCDGVPVMWASRSVARTIDERVAGADLVPRLLEHAADQNHRVFILGSTEEILERAVLRARSDNPDLVISGYYSPPVAALDDFDDEFICDMIQAARPDILLVAMGCPKQEKWISRNFRTLNVPVSIGVGASIDFLAGETARAPGWMQRMGAEWIFRLSRDPKRLTKRYARDLDFYGRAFTRVAIDRLATPPSPRPGPRTSITYPSAPDTVQLTWSGAFDIHKLREATPSIPSLEGVDVVILDCRRVTHMDEAGVGELIKVLRACRRAGATLHLTEMSAAAERAISNSDIHRLIADADQLVSAVA